MSSPVLRTADLQKFLGHNENRVHVLRGINLELETSKVYSVVGPSGCGKSTLLYLLGLLDRQDEGKIWIRDELMSEASDAHRTSSRNAHIGFVFQFHFLLPEFTALENLTLPMSKLGKLSESDMKEKAKDLLHEVGLSEKANRLATQLSGGEQQRVAVARALANDPALILADEPTGNLDVRNSNMVFDLLYKLAHEKGQAVLMVTHNQDLAKRADIIKAMEDGLFVS